MIKLTGNKKIVTTTRGRMFLEILCHCGKRKYVRAEHADPDKMKSCGCENKYATYKHGQSSKNKTGAYKSWQNARKRCYYKNYKFFHHYGGRGIKMSQEWDSFEIFYKDMGDRPKNKSLDRIDPNGNYCKENCRWATNKQQQNNKRCKK